MRPGKRSTIFLHVSNRSREKKAVFLLPFDFIGSEIAEQLNFLFGPFDHGVLGLRLFGGRAAKLNIRFFFDDHDKMFGRGRVD